MGVDCLASAGQVTLGPGGRNVALDYEAGQPKLTKDGVTVVKSIHLANRSVELGAKLLKKIAGATNTYAGDGTTSSAIIAREILKRGIHAVEFEKAHPIAVKRGIDKGLQVVLAYLKEISMPVT
jgi:chaperonin GroEL